MMIQQAQLDLILRTLEGVQAIYLFGSQHQGMATKESDVDLAVLAAKPYSAKLLWQLANKLAVQLDCDVDLVDLRSATTVMQYQVLNTGQRLWPSQETLDVGLFELMVFKEKRGLNFRLKTQLEEIKRTGKVYGG